MNNFHIRLANTRDQESIHRVHNLATESTVEQKHLWQSLIREGGLLVAETSGQLVGFGGIDVHAAEQLKWLYLLPEYQGAGLGSKILKRLEEIAWNADLRAIRLHAAPGAVEFYRRHGYKEVPAARQLGHDHEGVEMIKERS